MFSFDELWRCSSRLGKFNTCSRHFDGTMFGCSEHFVTLSLSLSVLANIEYIFTPVWACQCAAFPVFMQEKPHFFIYPQPIELTSYRIHRLLKLK